MLMGRLVMGALWHSGPIDSTEIDRGFDRAVDIIVGRAKIRREKQRLQKSQQPNGKEYYINGHFSEDGIPIPLEESFRAESLKEAIRITKEKARKYHNLEGYAVSLNLFDKPYYPRKVLHYVSIDAKEQKNS